MAVVEVFTQLEIRCVCGYGIAWNYTDHDVDRKEHHEKYCDRVGAWYSAHRSGHFDWQKHYHVWVYGACQEEIIRHAEKFSLPARLSGATGT